VSDSERPLGADIDVADSLELSDWRTCPGGRWPGPQVRVPDSAPRCPGYGCSVKSLLRRMVLAYSVRNRRRKAALISAFMRAHDLSSVILVGVAGVSSNRNEDVLERAVEQSGHVVAAFNVYPTRTPWPFLVADGCAMPFKDKAADLVISSAIIEHVGGAVEQRQFVQEHTRVGTTWVITTPNKWFPVESHTATMFRHWSPVWRAQREEFTRLLSKREFRSLLPEGSHIRGHPWGPTFMAFFSVRDPATIESLMAPHPRTDSGRRNLLR